MPQSLITSTPFEDFSMTSISSDLLSFCNNLQCLGVLRSFCPPASWLVVVVCLGHRSSFLSAVLCLLFPFVFLLSNCCSYNSVSGGHNPHIPTFLPLSSVLWNSAIFIFEHKEQKCNTVTGKAEQGDLGGITTAFAAEHSRWTNKPLKGYNA